MSDAKWERYGALVGGILFAALVVAALLLPGSPPQLDDSADEIVDFFQDNDTAIQVAAFLSGLSVVAALWWVGSLWRAMRRAEGGEPRLSVVAVLGLALAGSLYLASSAITSTVALRIDDIGAGAKYFYVLSFVFGTMTNFGIVVLLAAVSALAIRTGFLPRWLGWAGAVVAVLFLIGGYGVASDSDAIFTIGFVGFALWVIWLVVVSALLYRQRREATT